MKRRITAMMLLLAMVFSMLPVNVLAEEVAPAPSDSAAVDNTATVPTEPEEPTQEPVPTQEPTPTKEPTPTQEPAPTQETEAPQNDGGILPILDEETPAPTAEGHSHICEDCKDETVVWTAWTEKTTLPTKAGHYYLTDNVTLDAVATFTKNTVICLNGYTVTTNVEKRLININANATLSITDCKGTGKLQGKAHSSVGGLVWLSRSSSATTPGGVFNLYAGTLTGGSTSATGGGGAVYLQAGNSTTSNGTTFNMYGGKITDCHATGGPGGAIYAAALDGGTKATVNIQGGEISGNTSSGDGSVIYAGLGADITVNNASITKNTAGGTAAIRVTTGTLTITNSRITENKALNAAAINAIGSAKITITDSTITGNTNTSKGGYGAVNVGNKNVVLKLCGKTVIYGNKMGNSATAGTAQNIHLQKDAAMLVNMDGLTDGAKIGISLLADRIAAGYLQFTTDIAEGSNPLPYCVSDNGEYTITQDGAKLTLVKEEHENARTAWNRIDRLPTEKGNYFLAHDVDLGDTWKVGADIALCLNGHTVNGNVDVAAGGALTVTDCKTGALNGSITNNGALTLNKATINGNVTVAANAVATVDSSSVDGKVTVEDGADVTLSGTADYALYLARGAEVTANLNPTARIAVTMADGYGRFGTAEGTTSAENFTDATGSHTPYLANGELYLAHVHEGQMYTPWDGTGDTLTSGYYWLTGSETRDTLTVAAEQNVTLCLNGHTLTANEGKALLDVKGALTITDHDPNKLIGDNAPVSVSGTLNLENISLESCPVQVAGTFQMKDGSITGCTATEGSVVYAAAGATVGLTDVTVKDNTANSAVYISDDAAIQLAGLTVIANDTGKPGLQLCGTNTVIDADGLKENSSIGLTLDEGRIGTFTQTPAMNLSSCFTSDNIWYKVTYELGELKLIVNESHSHQADGTGTTGMEFERWPENNSLPNGGTHYLAHDVTLSDTWTIANGQNVTLCLSGHTITAPDGKPLVKVENGGTLTITNHGPGGLTGGDVVVDVAAGGKLTMYNLTISGGTKGLNVASGADVSLNGNMTITGDTPNLYLASGAKVTVNLDKAAKIGVTLETGTGEFATGTATSDNFISDNDAFEVSQSDGAWSLNKKHIQKCEHCDTDVTFAAWDGTTALTAGHYYLTANIAVSKTGSIAEDVVLCLNGNTITADPNMTTRMFTVNNGGTLTITDCNNEKPGSLVGSKNVTANGALICVLEGGKLNLYRIALTGAKTSGNGGAIQVTKNTETYLKGVSITGNTATNTGAFMIYQNAKVTIEDTTITGNIATSGYGAVNVAAAASDVTFKGNVIISGNTKGENGPEMNLHFQKDAASVKLDTLSETSEIGISMRKDRLNANQMQFAALTVEDTAIIGCFSSDDTAYGTVQVQRGEKFSLELGRLLCPVCGASCTEDTHSKEIFLAWQDTETLPVSGKYYLTGDVALKAAWAVGENAVLFMNGYGITGAEGEHLADVSGTLTLLGQGTLTGGKGIHAAQGGEVSLRNVTVSGTTGALYAEDGSKVTLTDVTITGNTTTGEGVVSVGSGMLTLAGQVIIRDNNIIDEDTQKNLHLRQESQINVSGLSAGSEIGISMGTVAGEGVFAVGGQESYFFSNGYDHLVQKAENDALELKHRPMQAHCLYGCAADCEHIQVIFTEWAEEDRLPTSGAYYLENDVTLSKVADISDTLTLCLNGKIVTQSGTDRIFNLMPGTSLTVCDHTGNGKLQGSKTVNKNGGIVLVQRKAKMELYGVTLTGAVNAHEFGGGAIYVQGGTAVGNGGIFHMYGGAITDNTATNGNGGAVFAGSTGASVENAPAEVMIENVSITGNTAKDGAALYIGGRAKVLLNDTAVTGNINTASGGAVSVEKGMELTLSGKTTIQTNTKGENGPAANLYFRSGATALIGTLEETAKIGVTMAALEGGKFAQIQTGGKAVAGNFVSDHVSYHINLTEAAVELKPTDPQNHCVEGCTDAAVCTHERHLFLRWEGTDSLPASGYYYLANSVKLTSTWTVAQDLTLCLNGQTITADPTMKHQMFKVNEDIKLVITDCHMTETSGLVGSKRVEEEGAFISVLKGGKLELYNITLRDAATSANGGAIRVTTNTQTKLQNVIIKNNQAKNISAIATYQNAKVTLIDTVITGNTAKDGYGAVDVNFATNGTNKVEIVIQGNTRIIGNTAGGKEMNLHLRTDAKPVALGNLGDDACIGVTMRAKEGQFGQIQADATVAAENLVSDVYDYIVTLKEGKASLVHRPTKTHCVKGCATDCDHPKITFTEWIYRDKLPTSGNYYLTGDVTLNSTVTVGKTLNLCLNGHSIKASSEMTTSLLTVSGENTKLTVTDCAQKAGSLVGSQAATVEGAIISVLTGAKLDLYNITLTGAKTAGNGGALRVTTDTVTNLTNVTITGNQAKNASAILMYQNAQVILTDTVITGNISTVGFGAVGVNTAEVRLTIAGNTQIVGNTKGKDGPEMNLYIRNEGTVVRVDELGKDAKVGVTMGKVKGGKFAELLTEGNATAGHFAADHTSYQVSMDDLDVSMEPIGYQEHCVQGCEKCEHEKLVFLIWEGTDSLPNSGNYYLKSDVKLNSTANITGRLNLCLNGKTVSRAEEATGRLFNVRGTLTITDCENTGTLLGRNSGIGTGDIAYVYASATLNLYQGILTGATTADGGGAISLQKGSPKTEDAEAVVGGTFNMYGGSLEGNKSTLGGAIYANPYSVVNIMGGTITGNTAIKDGGAIYLDANTKASISNVKITDNTAATAGAVFVKNSAVEISGATITGNTANNVSAIQTQGEKAAVTIADSKITGNLAKRGYGAVNLAGGELELKGKTEITDNRVGNKKGPQQNLHLQKGEKLLLAVQELGKDANVGISLAEDRIAAGEMTFTKDVHSAGTIYSDNLIYQVEKTDTAVKLADKTLDYDHQHCLANCADCHHGQQKYAAWTSTNSLPAKGAYYLTGNVTLSMTHQVTGDLNLCLNGHSITAAEGSRIMVVNTGAKLTVSDCTAVTENGSYKAGLLKGGESVYGGAVRVKVGAEFNLFGGIIAYNNSLHATDGRGGAIYLEGGSKNGAGGIFNMYGGQVAENQATYGGGVYANAGIDGVQKAQINLYGGMILNNTAARHGGGIYAGNNTAVTIQDGTVRKNNSKDAATTGDGGGICITGAGATMTMTGGSIEKNKAVNGGGVILLNGSSFVMKGGTVSGNECVADSEGKVGNGGGVYASSGTSFTMEDGTISGNKAARGAGMEAYKSTVLLKGGRIEKNQATGNGGGVYAGAETVFTVAGGTVSENKAAQGGGIDAYRSTITVESGLIENNRATGNGGGLYIHGTDTSAVMNGGKISGNKAVNGAGVLTETNGVSFTMNGGEIRANNCVANGETLMGYGGGLYISTGTVFTMNGGSITENKACNGGGLYGYRSTLTLNKGDISANRAVLNSKLGGGNGGGIYLAGTTAEIKAVTVSQNTATNTGAGMVAAKANKTETQAEQGSTVTIDGTVISGNKATGDPPTKTVGNAGGLAVRGTGTVVTVLDGEISGNNAENGGGVLVDSSGSLVLKKGTIKKNHAKTAGGGVYVSTGTNFQMEGGHVDSNTSKSGAGIYFLRSSGTLKSGTVSYNSASRNGGGIYVTGASVKLQGVTVSGNTAKKNGGGVITASTKAGGKTYYPSLTMSGGAITRNSAEHGAGVLSQSKRGVFNLYGGRITYNKASRNGGGLYSSTDTTFNMTGGTIAFNQGKYGAGVYQAKVTATYTGGEIHDNAALNNGGGMSITAGSVVKMKNLSIYNNTSTNGGAMVVQGGGTVLEMEQCSVYQNTGRDAGGGAYISSNVSTAIQSSKFYGNTTDKNGGGLYTAATSVVNMTDCEITGNTAGTNGGGMLVRGNVNMDNCLVSGNQATENGGGIATGKMGATGMGIVPGLVAKNTQITDNTSKLQGGGLYLARGSKAELNTVTITGNKAEAEGGALYAVDDLSMHSVTATGNTSGGAGYAVYLDAAEYDGHSYFVGLMKISGDMRILDNTGKDLFMGPEVAIAVAYEGLGKDTHMNVTLDSGVITDRIFGAYDFEGGSQVYTVTYGDRSLTDPEVAPQEQVPEVQETQSAEETQEPTTPAAEPEETGNGILWIGGISMAVALAAIGGIVLAQKKKTKKPENQTEEGVKS